MKSIGGRGGADFAHFSLSPSFFLSFSPSPAQPFFPMWEPTRPRRKATTTAHLGFRQRIQRLFPQGVKGDRERRGDELARGIFSTAILLLG